MVSVWSWISDSIFLPGWKEGNQVGKVMWDQITEDPDCEAKVSRLCAVGKRNVASFCSELCVRKMSPAVACKINGTSKKVEDGVGPQGITRAERTGWTMLMETQGRPLRRLLQSSIGEAMTN